LGIKAHAKQSVCVSVNTCPSRFTKESRSSSSQKIFRRSIPRTMIWCSAPSACVFAKATPAQVNSGFSWHVRSNSRKTPSCQSIYQYPSPISPHKTPSCQSIYQYPSPISPQNTSSKLPEIYFVRPTPGISGGRMLARKMWQAK